VISKADEYRARAIACEERAKKISDPVVKRQYQELAIHWRYRENQAARYGGAARKNLRTTRTESCIS